MPEKSEHTFDNLTHGEIVALEKAAMEGDKNAKKKLEEIYEYYGWDKKELDFDIHDALITLQNTPENGNENTTKLLAAYEDVERIIEQGSEENPTRNLTMGIETLLAEAGDGFKETVLNAGGYNLATGIQATIDTIQQSWLNRAEDMLSENISNLIGLEENTLSVLGNLQTSIIQELESPFPNVLDEIEAAPKIELGAIKVRLSRYPDSQWRWATNLCYLFGWIT